MKKPELLLAMSVTALVCAVPQATRAESAGDSTELQEVVVTAEHRGSDLQKVGLSVTAISGDELAQQGSADVAQVLQDVPGVVLQGLTDGPSAQSVQGGGGPPNIAIRGLGTPSPNTVGAVAVYEDGVLLQGGSANFYDMSRVEVLRGPQGTLYGRGATAGAVNFITNDPTQEFEASGRLRYGSYNTVATQGMVNVPLSDSFSLRAAYNQIRHDGYFNNGQSDEDDISSRVKLLFKPNENFSLLLGYTDYRSNGTGAGQIYLVGNPAPKKWETDLPGGTGDPTAYRKSYANLQWNMGPATLTYIGGYQTAHSDFTTYFHGFGPPFIYMEAPQPLNQTWTHELRLASNGDGLFTWVGGAYYFHNKLAAGFEPNTAAPVVGEAYAPAFNFAQWYAPTSEGLFGELTYNMTSATHFTAGLRETHDHVVETQEFEPGGDPAAGVPQTFDQKLNHFDWKARVMQDLTANNTLYGMVSTGYRPGGFVNGIASENETVRAYEVGSKNRLSNAITINAAAFYYDYSGFQNVATVPDPNNSGQLITVLIPLPAKFYGGEVEFTAQLSANDKLTLSPALLHAEYTGSAAGYATDGGTIPNTPKFSVSGSYAHAFPLPGGSRLEWSADAHYQGQTLTDFNSADYPSADPSFVQKAYTIANSTLSFTPESGKYTLSVYGKNLGNTLYKVTVYNAMPPAAYVNDPRTYGVMISAKL